VFDRGLHRALQGVGAAHGLASHLAKARGERFPLQFRHTSTVPHRHNLSGPLPLCSMALARTQVHLVLADCLGVAVGPFLSAALISICIALFAASAHEITAKELLLSALPAWLQGVGTVAAAYFAWKAFGIWANRKLPGDEQLWKSSNGSNLHVSAGCFESRWKVSRRTSLLGL